jgi:TMEM175 potassium channel family protein
VIGVALYALAAPVAWFLGPAVGLSFFVIMIIFHAVTSEGLHEGPLGRLFRVRRVDRR